VVERATIQTLMSAAADGDRASVEPLFAALWPIVVGYASRFLGDRVLAEDVAQDTLVKLFAQLARFDRERDALTWTLTHATWQCRTARRTRQRRAEVGCSVVEEVGEDRNIVEERELVLSALDTLAALPARDRDVIAAVLTDDDELRRSLAPETFRKRLERALGRLRQSWRSRHGTL
jgi:RNA polymerase sigma-70 factor (ECF subfamily)